MNAIVLVSLLCSADLTESDIRRRWASYEAIAVQLQGKTTISDFDVLAGQYRAKWVNEVSAGKGCYVERNYDLLKQSPDSVLGWNPKYAFALERYDNRLWLNSHIVFAPDAMKSPPFAETAERLKHNGPFYLFSASLPELAGRSGFVWRSIENVTRGGDPFIKVRFDYYPPAGSKTIERGGTVWLRMNEYRTIRWFEIDGQWGPDDRAIIGGEVDCFVSDHGTPLLRKESIVIRRPGADPVYRQLIREYDHSIREPETERCYLSYYGFVEPSQQAAYKKLWTWLAAVLATSLFLLRPKRRA